MKVYYRKHREYLSDSLETETVFDSFDELQSYFSSKIKVIIQYYGFDTRCGIGTTFIIMDNYPSSENYGGVMGFAYLRDIEEKENDK